MRTDGYLVLHYDRFSERVQSFFERLEGSAAFREVFLRDPAGTMSEVLLDGQVAGAELNQANRLLFALLGKSRVHELGVRVPATPAGAIRPR